MTACLGFSQQHVFQRKKQLSDLLTKSDNCFSIPQNGAPFRIGTVTVLYDNVVWPLVFTRILACRQCVVAIDRATFAPMNGAVVAKPPLLSPPHFHYECVNRLLCSSSFLNMVRTVIACEVNEPSNSRSGSHKKMKPGREVSKINSKFQNFVSANMRPKGTGDL